MAVPIPVYPTITPKIPLPQALEKVAAFLDLDDRALLTFAEEDVIGGYHHDPEQRRINDDGQPAKGIWGVEGQVVYALIRALRPRHVLEVGNCWGTSTLHIGEAVLQNKVGKVTTLDLPPQNEARPKVTVPSEYETIMRPVFTDLRGFNYRTRPLLDFVFEDSFHTPELVSHVWREFQTHAKSGAVIVSHDSEHFRVGPEVRRGIEQVVKTGEYLSIAIDPADCGLALWRKP